MRLLFVTPYVPSRIRVRPFHLIQALAPSHEISLVSLVCDRYEEELAQEVTKYCASVDLVHLPKWQAYVHCLQALPSSLPLRVAYYQSLALQQHVQKVIQQQSIEVVHGELIKTAPVLHSISAQKSIPILYDSVDCISSYLQQQWSSSRNLLHKAFVSSELGKMRCYEQRTMAICDQVIVTSGYDRNCLIELGEQQERVQVVPNGVDSEYFHPPMAPRDQDSLVFCAKMDYYPNAQAVLYFCREILPRIWEHRPQVRLTIVGNNPPQTVCSLSADQRITVTGYVPDIRPYLGKASIALAPLLVAAGMQNKVLEALAIGAPLVATPASCRSLQVQDGKHLLLAEGVQAFADAILRLLEDTQLACRLGNAGREYVEQHHCWQSAASLLDGLYKEAVQAHRKRKLANLSLS